MISRDLAVQQEKITVRVQNDQAPRVRQLANEALGIMQRTGEVGAMSSFCPDELSTLITLSGQHGVLMSFFAVLRKQNIQFSIHANGGEEQLFQRRTR